MLRSFLPLGLVSLPDFPLDMVNLLAGITYYLLFICVIACLFTKFVLFLEPNLVLSSNLNLNLLFY